MVCFCVSDLDLSCAQKPRLWSITLGWVVYGEGDVGCVSLEGLECSFLKGGCLVQNLMALSIASRNHVEEACTVYIVGFEMDDV